MLNRRNVTVNIKHFEDCEQHFMSVGHCYLIEALLQFFKMDNVNESPKENSPCPSKVLTDDENKVRILAVLSKFVDEFAFQATAHSDDEEMSADDDEDDGDVSDGLLNYSLNLIRSFMVLLDCKQAVASGDGEHLAIIHKQMLLYFSSVSGFNSYVIEMLISTIQNAVLLSPAEAHQCKWLHWRTGKVAETETLKLIFYRKIEIRTSRD